MQQHATGIIMNKRYQTQKSTYCMYDPFYENQAKLIYGDRCKKKNGYLGFVVMVAIE